MYLLESVVLFIDMDTVEEYTAIFEALKLVKGPRVGKGGSGEVFLATSEDKDSKTLAVKIVELEKDDEISKEDFLSELSFLRDLRHPHVVKLMGFGLNPIHGCIVMKHYSHGSLDKIVDSVDLPHALGYILDVGSALEHMHQLNMYHQDVKPANIFVDSDGLAVLGDFGLAGRLKKGDTKVPRWVTTPGFSGPETKTGQPMCPFKVTKQFL